MRKQIATCLLLLGISPAYADNPIIAKKSAPTQLGVTVCRVVDWTGKRPLADGVRPSKDWRDLEWFRDQEQALECKFEIIQLEDAVAMNYSAKEAAALHPDWSEHGQCSARSMDLAPRWAASHPGWYPLAIGCPKRITQEVEVENGKVDVIIDYAIPPCPAFEPGTDHPMKCKFSEGMI